MEWTELLPLCVFLALLVLLGRTAYRLAFPAAPARGARRRLGRAA